MSNLGEVREGVQAWPAARALYRLCGAAAPVDARARPGNLRWAFFDAGAYPAIAAAYAAGAAGAEPPPAAGPGSLLAAAWLAGLDRRA